MLLQPPYSAMPMLKFVPTVGDDAFPTGFDQCPVCVDAILRGDSGVLKGPRPLVKYGYDNRRGGKRGIDEHQPIEIWAEFRLGGCDK